MVHRPTSQVSPQPIAHQHRHLLIGPRQSFTSEQNLMLAVLSDAIEMVLRPDSADNHYAALQAWNWIMGRGKCAVSFEDACDAVGLNCRALREHLYRLRQRQRAAGHPVRH